MRHFDDWLLAYCDYASFTEAPRRMHFWSGVCALAGALRRHIWFDQYYFKWFPNHYTVLVADPGIATKTTTIGIAMDLLHQVPGVSFGPNAVTGPKLVDEFSEHMEQFVYQNQYITQSALTIESSELGNLLDPEDRDLIDWLVDLWDAKTGTTTKGTRGQGLVSFENPFLNILACTTPRWLEGNVPEHMIGGGFTSRCVFVYADHKEKLIAYPKKSVPLNFEQYRDKLTEDLVHISTAVVGPCELTPEAYEWGEHWYADHYANPPPALADNRFKGYLARKQSHLHKAAMVISAARRDDRIIGLDELITASTMLNDIERDLPRVFDKIGRSPESIQVDRFVDFIFAYPAGIAIMDAYRFIHTHFPDVRDFDSILAGIIKAGYVTFDTGTKILKPGKRPEVSGAKKDAPKGA